MCVHLCKFQFSLPAVRILVPTILASLGTIYFGYHSSINNTYLKDPHDNKCGVILFVHIPKTGGGSVFAWLKKHAAVLNMFDGTVRDRIKNQEQNEQMWKNSIPKANEFMRDISPKTGWKSVHLHHYFPGMHYSKDIIKSWKTIVEGKGCVFHKTTIFRDPLDRFVSLLNYLRVPLNDIDETMRKEKNMLIRYFLFGNCDYQENEIKCRWKTPKNLNQNYMADMMKILSEFDSIGFLDRFEEYLETIRNITGWKENDVVKIDKVHESQDSLKLTSKMLKSFLNMNKEDYLFYYYMKNKLYPIYKLDVIT